jgi:hypothetical protein
LKKKLILILTILAASIITSNYSIVKTSTPDLQMLTVKKVTDPGSSNQFDFLDYDSNSFKLRDYSIYNEVGEFWVVPGSYTFEELIESGWILDDIEIYGDTDGGSVKDLANRKITVDIDEGEDIEIVFKNKQDPETCTVIVEKIVDWGIDSNYMDSPLFDFTITNPITAFSLGDGESITFSGLSPGEYVVVEDLMGWMPAEIIRKGGGYDDSSTGNTGAVEIEAGETITITFINRPPDFVIPEMPYGTILSLLAMLTSIVLIQKKPIKF